jgi:hypothetical protein
MLGLCVGKKNLSAPFMEEKVKDSENTGEAIGFFKLFAVIAAYSILAEILGAWLYMPLAKGLAPFIVLLICYAPLKTSRSPSFAKWVLFSAGIGLFFFLVSMWFG